MIKIIWKWYFLLVMICKLLFYERIGFWRRNEKVLVLFMNLLENYKDFWYYKYGDWKVYEVKSVRDKGIGWEMGFVL